MPYYGDGAMPYYYSGGAFANHSSLMTGVGRSYHNPIAARYSPHLSTISETPFVTLRRYSPVVTGPTSTSLARPRRTIDTADIDVSKPPRSLTSENREQRHRLRRDRPTIKIRSQALKDNPALREYNERHEKTVGELLVEKFLIKDKQEDQKQPRMRLYHQASLQSSPADEPATEKERENEILAAIRRRVTRRMTRRRSSADVLPLDPEQIEREAAFHAIQAEALDSLVAEEQKEIEVEMRRGTFAKRQAMRLASQPSESEEEEQEAEGRRSRHTATKKKKRRKSVERVVVVPIVRSDEEDEEDDDEESILEIPESVIEEDEEEEEEEEFKWDDRDKCDDVRKLIPLKSEDAKLGKLEAADLKVDTVLKKNRTIVAEKELVDEKVEKKDLDSAKVDKKKPVSEKIEMKDQSRTKIDKKESTNSEIIKREPTTARVEKKDPKVAKDQKEPVSTTVKKETAITVPEKAESVTVTKKETVTTPIEKKQAAAVIEKKEPASTVKKDSASTVLQKKESVSVTKKESVTTTTEKKEPATTVTEKKEAVSAAKKETSSAVPEKKEVEIKKEPVTTPSEKKEIIAAPTEKTEPLSAPKKEPVSAVPEAKEAVKISKKESVTAPVKNKEPDTTVIEKKEPVSVARKEPITIPTEKKEASPVAIEKKEAVRVAEKESDSATTQKKESVSTPKKELVSAIIETKEPVSTATDKVQEVAVEIKVVVPAKSEKKEPESPKGEKQEPVTPKVEKVEPATPKLEKQEPVTPKVEKVELATPKLEKQEPVTPKVEKLEPKPPKLEKQEPVTPKVEKLEPKTPKLEKPEPVTSKVEKVEPATPKLEKQEPKTPKLEKQEPKTPKLEKQEPKSPKLEKQEPKAPQLEKKEPLTAKIDKKPKSPKKREAEQTKLKRTVSAPLDDSPCFKVEACNSEGDFSTLYVRAAESPVRTIEQFRESIRLPAPRRPQAARPRSPQAPSQAPSHIETEVVLPVRRPYVRDPSRNSVYLALKPSQRPALEDTRKALAEEAEAEATFDRRPRPAKVDVRRSISDAAAADRRSAPRADEFVAWWDEPEKEAASELLTTADVEIGKETPKVKVEAEVKVDVQKQAEVLPKEERSVPASSAIDAPKVDSEEAKIAPAVSSVAQEITVDIKIKEESKPISPTEKKSIVKSKATVEESVSIVISEKTGVEVKKTKVEESKVLSATEKKPLVNKSKESLPSSTSEKKVEESKKVKVVSEESKPPSPVEKKLLPSKAKVISQEAVPASPTEKKAEEAKKTKIITEEIKPASVTDKPLSKSVTPEETRITSPTDKKPLLLSASREAKLPRLEEKIVTIEIEDAKPTSPEAISSTEPKATSDSTKSTPDKKTSVETTQSTQEDYPLSGERPILARREKAEERKGRVFDAEAVMKIEKRILEEAESPSKILTGAIPEAERPLPPEKVGLATTTTTTTKKSAAEPASAAGTEIDFWSEIKAEEVSGKAQSGLRLECVLDSRPEEDEERTPLVEAAPSPLLPVCNGRPEEDDEPPTPTNDQPEELTGTVKKISKWGNRDNLADLAADADATPVVSASSSIASTTTKKKVVKRKKSTATGKKKADGESTKSKTSTRKAAAKKTAAAAAAPPTSAAASSKNTPAQRPADLMKMFYTTPAILLTATPRDLRKVRRAKVKRKKPPTRTPSLSSDSTGSTRSTATTSTEEGSNCEEDAEQKRLASTRSNDSGFDGSPRLSNCDMVCHKKCEKLTGNLCGLNQKLVAEALQALKKAPSQSSENQRNADGEHYHHSGRITPPATNLPRFKKYEVTDFNFLKVLGKGSFGKVLLAELRGTECVYAVKCLKKDVVLEDDDVECTLIERKVLTLATRHPYLCHLFCTFQTESHLFFVMEYLNGGDLMFHIQKSGRFSEARAKFYAAEIWSGLIFLHKKGIVYRDLKLDNVLLDFEGHIRIADFGMCKLQIFLDRTADTFCGTPDYMAPEIIKGLKYNQAVDWWSFGVLLYEMLTGQSPFSGCDEDELFWSICNERPFIPRYLSQSSTDILVCLLEKDAGKRIPGHEIACHPFFCTIAWDKLERRSLEAPFKPAVEHTLDTRYFDTAFTAERPRLTPVPEQILTSMDQAVFRGFSYTNPNATD